jgi:large subunit ribosomal protein L22
LLVREAVVGEGPTLKRFRARARGGASPILKRTSHIRIILSDDFQPKTETKRSKKAPGAEDKTKAKRKATGRKPRTPNAKSETPNASAETQRTPAAGRRASAAETQHAPEEKE